MAVQLSGILVVDKPPGMTSRAAVNRVIQLVPGIKAGHAGTLDPLATGVLVICLGTATRLVELIQEQSKTYVAGVRLGARSDTFDADGRIELEECPRRPSRDELESALGAFTGWIDQTPPQFSALKIGGRRAHVLARQGAEPVMKPRQVRIDRLRIVDYDWPRLVLEVDCGGGTYIRSLARDLALAVGTWGHIEALKRTRIGHFSLEQASDLKTLTPQTLESAILDPVAAVVDRPQVVLSPDQLAGLSHGRTIELGPISLPCANPDSPIALLDPQGKLQALAEFDPDRSHLKPRKVLFPARPIRKPDAGR